jgi:ABC-2 type transport system ATP-binding protein
MSAAEPAVRLEEVTKSFGLHTAVDRLRLEIPRGVIYGLLGPNGSGKTTTLRMIMGILRPDRGRVRLFGDDPDGVRRERVGYLPEERGLYRKMKVLDVLLFLAEIRGVPAAVGRARAREWLERLDLAGWEGRRVEDLSKGMQQKVQFIGTILHEPDLLVLDEPFSGLDPLNQDVLEEMVRGFRAAGTTVLFSTHLMDQAERLCERVCLISGARKVLDGELAALKARERQGVLAVEFEGDDRWLAGPEVAGIEGEAGRVHLLLHRGADPRAVLRRGVAAGARVRRFEVVEPSLHEIFVRHAGRRAGGAVEGGVGEGGGTARDATGRGRPDPTGPLASEPEGG